MDWEALRGRLNQDPRAVADEAAQVAAEAKRTNDPEQLSRALAVLGRAWRSLGEIVPAESDLRSAIEAARQVKDLGTARELEADAHVGLAGVLSFAGRTTEGLEHLDTATALGSETVRAYAGLQRSIVQQRTGDLTAARAGYDAALPVLRRLGARRDVAMVLINRGVIRTQTGEIAGATSDLTEAAALMEQEGNAFGVAQTLHGLGWAEARGGNLPAALQHLEDAMNRFEALGHAALEVHVDRVEVLLAAGLSAEALRVGAETADRLAAAGNRSQAAETWLLCAQAARVSGDAALGADYAGRAQAQFADQGSEGWERAAHLEALRAVDPQGHVAELRGLADGFDAAGNAVGAATALALACAGGDATSGLADECRARAARLGVLEVRLLAEYAAAVVALEHDDRASARRRLRAGLDDLQRHRVLLGASDARAAVSSHAARLTALGLRMAVEEGRAAGVFEWIERSLAGRRRHPPARPPDDVALADELAELRAVAAEARQAIVEGRDSVDIVDRQRRLEQRIHRAQLKAEGRASAKRWAPPAIAEVRETLGARVFVEIAEVDGRLVGVCVPGDETRSRTRWVDLGPTKQAARPAAAIASALRSLTTSATARGQLGLVDKGLSVLTTLLRPALPQAHADDVEEVVLVVPAFLQTVPWARANLAGGRPVVVAPSATWWSEAQAHEYPTNPTVLAVAGPRLAEADQEARDVAAAHRTAMLLVGEAATAEAVAQGLGAADIAHIAAHGRLRADNPLWSSIELADGPLCVYDLERLDRTPSVVVLSACDSGAGSKAGDGLLGVATALLNLGTQSLIATVCPLPDTPATREAMVAIHRGLAAGRRPAAVLAALDTDPVTGACVAAFGA